MTEDDIKLETRLYAIECLLATHFAGFLFQGAPADPSAACAEVLKQQLEGAKQKTFPTFGPAMSDHVAGELEAAVTRLGAMVSEQIALIVKAQRSLRG